MSHSKFHLERWRNYQGNPIDDGLLFVIRLGPDLLPPPPPPPPPTPPPVLWILILALLLVARDTPWTPEEGKLPTRVVAETTSPEPSLTKKPLEKRNKLYDRILDQLKRGEFGLAKEELEKAQISFPGDKELEGLLEGLHQGLSLRTLKFLYQTGTEGKGIQEGKVLVPPDVGKYNLTSEDDIALMSGDSYCIEFVPSEDSYLYIYQIDSYGRFYWYSCPDKFFPTDDAKRPCFSGFSSHAKGTKLFWRTILPQ